MKKLNILASLFAGLLILTGCETDNDSNPTVQMPKDFVLNEPANASNPITLEQSEKLFFSVKEQPAYGYTAAVNYQLEVDLNDAWTEATENTEASYITLEDVCTSVKMEIGAIGFAKAIVKLNGWGAKEDVPETAIEVYVRAKAYLSSLADKPCYSNSVKIKIYPYYVADAAPQLWFFVGNGAVGNWNNGAGDMGNSTIPLALVADAEYDSGTGEGEFTYTGYFAADQFKLVLNPGNWEPMWGLEADGENGTLKYRAPGGADPACWKPSAAGYYTFSFNSTGGTASTKAELKPYTGDTPKVFDHWEFVGAWEGWGVTPIVLTQNAFNPHIWYVDAEFAEDTEGKFRCDANLTDECGGDGFPYGLKTSNNIKIPAGSYRIVFNDLNRCYYFFVKE